MQTFLPYPDFIQSAQVLDRQRLGKQRVEGLQILNTLTGRSTGWSTHPAVKMWRGHEKCLAEYTMSICVVWIARGYKDTVLTKVLEMYSAMTGEVARPAWLGRSDIHESHQSNLLRKDPNHYRQFWPDLTDALPYVWPEES